jgi:uncharacterized protein (TIGR03437 family)
MLRNKIFAGLFIIYLYCLAPVFGQSDSLALSSGSATQGGSVSLNFSLTSPAGSEPAALQWTFTYSSSDIATISASAGPASSAAGKSIICSASPGSYTCLLSGINTNVISNGVVAIVNVTLSPSMTSSTTISVANPIAASPTGSDIPITGAGGVITVGSGGSITVTSLTCNPAGLVSLTASTCTVALNQAAPSNTNVALSDNSSGLSVPASVMVAAGNTTANFSATAGTITAVQAAVITATLGSSSQTASLVLAPVLNITSLTCSPSTLNFGGSATCTVAMNRIALQSRGISVSTNNSSALSVPSTVTLPAHSSSTTFSITAGSVSGQFTLTATFASVSQWVTITVNGAQKTNPPNSPAVISSVACTPTTLIGSASANCTVGLSQPAQSNGTQVALATNAGLQIPEAVTVPPGNTTARFVVHGCVSDSDQTARILATTANSAATAKLSVQGITPVSFSCQPKVAQAGSPGTCEVQLNSAQIPDTLTLNVSSSSPDIQVPASITTRPMQSTLSFEIYTNAAARQQSASLQVRFGLNANQISLITVPTSHPALTAPSKVMAKVGMPARFTVSGTDGHDAVIALSAAKMPSGASFDPTTGTFNWIPGKSQVGTFNVGFAAVNSLQASTTRDVRIEVGAGEPIAASLVNGAAQDAKLACSPGGIASLIGSWLVQDDSTAVDASGRSTQLGGTRVKVNGDYVPVLYASGTRVDFLCPSFAPGVPLHVSLETAAGQTGPIDSPMQEAAPGIVTADGSGRGRGMILFPGTSELAVVRNPLVSGEPAQPGDTVALRVTGVSPDADATINIGGVNAPVESIRPSTELAGLSEVLVKIPAGAPVGDAVPVRLDLPLQGGEIRESNVVTMAIELVRP